jgi:hypothetical protein
VLGAPALLLSLADTTPRFQLVFLSVMRQRPGPVPTTQAT